ncbi:MAG: HlyC/CorC family transporter [Clostridia bacterium]|nr:HlyC/CorC family transporter [Clostridia bacterium]
MNIPLYIAIMAVLILFSAYFSATETAFSSLSKTRLKVMSEESKKAALAYTISENYDKLISTVLIGNNIVNIAVASLGTVMFVDIIGEGIGATVSTVVVTIIVLIFGEVTPKGIAKNNPENFAVFSAPIINLLMILFTPLSFILSKLKNLISKIFKSKKSAGMSQEELLLIVDEVEQEGVIDEDESELLHNAIEFSELCAEDILTHRVDIEAVSIDADKKDIAHIFSTTKFSRLLVYEDTIDKIVGVIHQKDFYSETAITRQSIRDIMSTPIFILKNEKIDDILRKLQQAKSHIAVILDEYGGTYGIVTMEDILEELVGDIWDEHDEVVEEFTEVEENIFRVDGMMNFEDFCKEFDIEAESQSISLGGWVAEQLERIPEAGDSFDFGKLHVTVTDTDTNRASLIEIKIKEEAPEEELVTE